MPFGLSNSPATYQSLAGELNMTMCLVYIDDLIIFSQTLDEHLKNRHKVFDRLRRYHLKLAPEKCHFYRTKVSFLGHLVSGDVVQIDPDKIAKIRDDWPIPTKADELRSFLAFGGYYRRFIKDFSKIIRPLAELLPPSANEKGKEKINKEWSWNKVHQETFDKLKGILTSPPVLGYPEFDKLFELHTDASTQRLDAVLYQQQGDHKQVIFYPSRALSKSEKNFSAYKLEF